jgi:cyclic pyranopterin phosphate synthase
MVDISGKERVARKATAEGVVRLSARSIKAIKEGKVKKGDVLEVARVAAVAGVKNTPLMIPFCHTVPVEGVDVGFRFLKDGVKVTCKVKARYRTGVEMEAIAGVVCALMTVWDMVKYLEKDKGGQYPRTRIEGVRVVEKRKGKGKGKR